MVKRVSRCPSTLCIKLTCVLLSLSDAPEAHASRINIRPGGNDGPGGDCKWEGLGEIDHRAGSSEISPVDYANVLAPSAGHHQRIPDRVTLADIVPGLIGLPANGQCVYLERTVIANGCEISAVVQVSEPLKYTSTDTYAPTKHGDCLYALSIQPNSMLHVAFVV